MRMIRAMAKGTIKEKEFPPIGEEFDLFLSRVIGKIFMEIMDTLNIRKIP